MQEREICIAAGYEQFLYVLEHKFSFGSLILPRLIGSLGSEVAVGG